VCERPSGVGGDVVQHDSGTVAVERGTQLRQRLLRLVEEDRHGLDAAVGPVFPHLLVGKHGAVDHRCRAGRDGNLGEGLGHRVADAVPAVDQFGDHRQARIDVAMRADAEHGDVRHEVLPISHKDARR
jgi:hypothetical protein